MEEILRKMTIAQRIDYLRDNAESTTQMSIERRFDDDEMDDLRQNLRLRERKLEELKEQIKTLKGEAKGILEYIVTGYRETEEEVFWLFNSDTRMMEAWDRYGDLQRSRKLKPEEKQTLIPFTFKPASNE